MNTTTSQLLGELTQIRTGKLDANASSPDGAYPFFTCAKEPLRISSFSYDCDCVLVAGNGDLNVKHYKGKFDAYQRTYIVEPKNSSILDSRYLFHFLDKYVEKLRELSIGGVIKYIKIGNLSDALIPLPPLEEQRRIAAILDQAETLRTQRRTALALLDSLTQSLFLDMFGAGNTRELTIGELLEKKVLLLHKDGNHGSLYPRAEEFGEQGVPFLSARCVSDGGEIQEQFIDKLRDEKAHQLRIGWIEKGDVLLAHNASVGKVALYDGRYPKALIGTSLTAFRADPSILSPSFLAAAFRSAKFQAQLFKNMGQTTRNQVPITAQRELMIPLPPLPLQQTFATRIASIEALKATHRRALAALDALFASLQQRAFTGAL